MYITLPFNTYVIKTLLFLTFNPSFLIFHFFFKERGKGEGEGNIPGGDEGEDVLMIGGDDDEDKGAVGGTDVQEEESSSSSDKEEEGGDEGDSPEKKTRKKESDIQRKVKKFWKERGRVVYGCEWQTYL